MNNIDQEKLRLWITVSINRSLWGSIRPNLRGVSYSKGVKTLEIYCYYDGEISDLDRELMIDAEGV
jgi:hypothetical protein